MSAHDQAILWVLWSVLGLLLLPIVACWVLFLIAWLKGWAHWDMTPIDIIERLRKE